MDPTRLHPQARTALAVQERAPLSLATVGAMRQSMRDATPVEVGAGPPVATVVDVAAAGVPTRLYRDGAAGRAPVVVFAHGGGWVMGDLDTHDGLCRHLVAASGWAVLAVDYRRAPEHPYPAAIDDVSGVVDWVRGAGADRYGLDPGRIVVAGDSAGGQLAAVAARRARDAGIGLTGQILICPVLDPAGDYPGLDDYGLSREEMRFFWDAYAPPGVDRDQPDLSPLAADLTGLPPALIVTAQLDVLGDEGERYAAALLRAGVPVVAARYQGLTHDFPRKLALFDAAHAAVAQIGAGLRRW